MSKNLFRRRRNGYRNRLTRHQQRAFRRATQTVPGNRPFQKRHRKSQSQTYYLTRKPAAMPIFRETPKHGPPREGTSISRLLLSLSRWLLMVVRRCRI